MPPDGAPGHRLAGARVVYPWPDCDAEHIHRPEPSQAEQAARRAERSRQAAEAVADKARRSSPTERRRMAFQLRSRGQHLVGLGRALAGPEGRPLVELGLDLIRRSHIALAPPP
jgi:hypothetical protein